MNFNYSEMQQMLVETASRLISDNYTLEAVRHQHTLPNGLKEENWQLFAELGWLALPLPENAGGLGGSFEDVVVLSTMLGRALAVEPYTSTVVIGADMLGAIGDAETRNQLLGQIASGDLRVALAHGEPNERYADSGPRQTRARASGNRVSLSGQKLLVIDAPSATHLIVSATTDDGEMGLYLVPAGIQGATLETYPLVDGAAAADVVLQDVTLD